MGLMKPLLYICKGLKGDSESNSSDHTARQVKTPRISAYWRSKKLFHAARPSAMCSTLVFRNIGPVGLSPIKPEVQICSNRRCK